MDAHFQWISNTEIKISGGQKRLVYSHVEKIRFPDKAGQLDSLYTADLFISRKSKLYHGVIVCENNFLKVITTIKSCPTGLSSRRLT